VVDVVENIDRFIDAHVTRQIIFKYYIFNLPYFFNLSLPIAMLIAAVFSIGNLARHNELIAMKSSGISLYRIALPLLILSFLVAVFSFALGETIVLKGLRARAEIEKRYIEKSRRYRQNRRYNIFIQDSKGKNIIIGTFNLSNNRGKNINVQYFKKDTMIKRIDAKDVSWLENERRWVFENGVIREFQGGEERIYNFSRIDSIKLNFSPADLKKQFRKPEEMSYLELRRFIEHLRRNGVDTKRWLVNLHFKISFAFTNFIVILFGVPLSANKKRGGAAIGVGSTLFVCFVYYGFIKLGQILGIKGILPPALSVWVGNIVFLVSGIYILIMVKK
jgi:LPS export ABC transporter permease LptG